MLGAVYYMHTKTLRGIGGQPKCLEDTLPFISGYPTVSTRSTHMRSRFAELGLPDLLWITLSA